MAQYFPGTQAGPEINMPGVGYGYNNNGLLEELAAMQGSQGVRSPRSLFELPQYFRDREAAQEAAAWQQQQMAGLLAPQAQELVGPPQPVNGQMPAGLMGETQPSYGPQMAMDMLGIYGPGSAVGKDQLDFLQSEYQRNNDVATAQQVWERDNLTAYQKEQVKAVRDKEQAAQSLLVGGYNPQQLATAYNTFENSYNTAAKPYREVAGRYNQNQSIAAKGLENMTGLDDFEMLINYAFMIKPDEAFMRDDAENIRAAGGALNMADTMIQSILNKEGAGMGETMRANMMANSQRIAETSHQAFQRLYENEQRQFEYFFGKTGAPNYTDWMPSTPRAVPGVPVPGAVTQPGPDQTAPPPGFQF